MADTKISALSDGSPLQSGDAFVVARSGADYKIPASSLKEFLVADKKTLTSGDITWTATTFTDISASLDITLTTGARRCLVSWTLVAVNSNAAPPQLQVDVDIDGTRAGQTFGLVAASGIQNKNMNLSGAYVTDVLSAASHTFKLMFRVDANNVTTTIRASTSITPIVFSVVELAT